MGLDDAFPKQRRSEILGMSEDAGLQQKTHEWFIQEAYARLVTPGSYCVVFDTIIENMAGGAYPDWPRGRGNNPKTAVEEFLRCHPEFEVDETVDAKLQISVATGRHLRRLLTQ